jgi:quinol monooxygenase YgiN
MPFIQTIEFTTTRIGEIEELMDEWVTKSARRRTPHRATLLVEQDRPNTYLQIVEFDSYEEAMQNNALPETAEFAEKASKLVDSGPVYRNLEVSRIDDLS